MTLKHISEQAAGTRRGMPEGGHRAATRLAWSLWGISVSLAAASVFLPGKESGIGLYLPFALFVAAFATVGALVVSRLPANPLGWICCALGLFQSTLSFATRYSEYALLVRSGTPPAGEAAAWVSSWILVPVPSLLVLLLFLFPTGGLSSNRWRSLLWLTVAVLAAGVISQALLPGSMAGLDGTDNPLGVEAGESVLRAVANAWQPVSAALLLVALVSVFLRMRRADYEERQQIKWWLMTYLAVGHVKSPHDRLPNRRASR